MAVPHATTRSLVVVPLCCYELAACLASAAVQLDLLTVASTRCCQLSDSHIFRIHNEISLLKASLPSQGTS